MQDLQELIELYRQLSEEQQAQFLDFAKAQIRPELNPVSE